MKFVSLPFHSYRTLMLEFFTTLNPIDDSHKKFAFRLGGSDYTLDNDLMFRIFRFSKGDVCDPPSKYHAKDFWAHLTGRKVLKDNYTHPNGLIIDPSYIIVHKFMRMAIFRKTESNKISHQELLMLWCMHTKTHISTTYFVLHTLW